jgi:quercetin dioxygenase-like cupin family protein
MPWRPEGVRLNPQPVFLPPAFAPAAELPWIPARTRGRWSKPLRFLPGDAGFVELLRMEPGTVMPLHRHSGEVHCYNLSGSRRLCTGELIGPGDYVYEPAGHTDWWEVVGAEPLELLVVVTGTIEFLGPADVVTGRIDAAGARAAYARHCREHGLVPQEL